MQENAPATDGPGSPIKVFVPGTVKPWPRPIPLMKHHRGRIRCSPKEGCRVKVIPGTGDREWRKVVAAKVGMIVGGSRPWFQEGDPLVLAARFYFLRPKSHFVANDRSRPLKANAPRPEEFGQKPDL